jgi:hypothetical protein
MREKLWRGLSIPLLVSALAFATFLRSAGARNVCSVDMVTLIAVGMGLGVALAHIRILVGMKSRS